MVKAGRAQRTAEIRIGELIDVERDYSIEATSTGVLKQKVVELPLPQERVDVLKFMRFVEPQGLEELDG